MTATSTGAPGAVEVVGAVGEGRLLRDSLGRFATGVAVVTTASGTGERTGVTINSFTSVSLDPPLVLWCLRRGSSALAAFLGNPRHDISVLAADQESLARRFARSGHPRPGPPTPPDFTPEFVPEFPGSAAHLSCRRREILDGGDHVIFLNEVLAHRSWPRPPLIFLDGAYTST